VKKLALLAMVAAAELSAGETAAEFLSVSPLKLGDGLAGYYESPAPFAYGTPVPLGIYMGALLQPVVMPMDGAAFIDKGEGWGFVLGFSPDALDDPEGIFGLELIFAMSTHHDPATGNDVDYTRLSLGVRWWDNIRPQVMPYLAFGVSFSDISNNPGGTELSGWGFYGGGGVSVFPKRFISIGLDVKVHVWGGDDQFGMVKYGLTPVVSAAVLFHF